MKVKDLMALPQFKYMDDISVFRINPKTYRVEVVTPDLEECVAVGDYRRVTVADCNYIEKQQIFTPKIKVSQEEVENMNVYDIRTEWVFEENYIEIFVM